MTIDQASVFLQDAIRMTLVLSAPTLATALFSGLLISIFQAATQVNEQTLSFVPKVVLTLGVFAFLFPWMMGNLVDFSHQLLDHVAKGPIR